MDFKRILIMLPLFLAFGLGSCVSLPGSDRKAFIVTSAAQEAAMGEEAYRDLLRRKVSNDPRMNAILQRVGKRIAAASPVSDFQWEFKLIESKEMNAFCLPGGKVAFTPAFCRC